MYKPKSKLEEGRLEKMGMRNDKFALNKLVRKNNWLFNGFLVIR